MDENKKSSLIGSIAKSIKSKMGLGSSVKPVDTPAEATAENKQSVENINFELIKTSFVNIEGSFNKLNEVFEGIHNSLQFLTDQKDAEKYQQEENQLEGEKAPLPKPNVAEKEKGSSFFNTLKSFIMNPVVIAALSGIVYAVLPKETQEKIKAVLGGFATGLDKSTEGFSCLSTGIKVMGTGLALFVGGKIIRSVFDAISLTVKLIKGFANMGRFGKAAIVGIAAVGIGKYLLDDKTAEGIEKEKVDLGEDEKAVKQEYYEEDKKDVVTDDTGKPVAIMEEKADPAGPAPEASSAPAGVGQPSKEQPMADAKPAASPELATPTTVNQQISAQAPKKPEPVVAAPVMQASMSTTPQSKPSVESSAPAPSPLPEKTAKTTTAENKPTVSSSPKKGPGLSGGVSAMKQAISKEGVTNTTAIAQILAQTAHESGGFRYTEELASGKAYEGRRDLGNVEPGDGVKYKGRGFLQVTGRSNYAAISKDLGVDFVNNPSKLADPKYAAESALWFFKRPWNAKRIKDWGDTRAVTKVVNGGYNGLADREKYFDKFLNDPSTTQVATADLTPQQQAQSVMSPKSSQPLVSSAKVEKGTQIASLSTKNEAMASPKAMAPIVQNTSINRSQSPASKTTNDPIEIPLPIANRGSLSGNVTHDTQYA